nr:histone-lysine N-methyltransferase SUVR3 [Fagopyrum tataricum]
MKKHNDVHHECPVFTCSYLIFPWLNPQELASISITCKTLNKIAKSVTAARSADASRSFENLPIPFLNAIDSHPYTYFLYTHTQLLPSTQFDRQFWGSTILNFEPSIPRFPPIYPFWTIAESSGCDCGEKCGDDAGCPCCALKSGEVITECGPSCKCGLECRIRLTQKGVSVRVKVVRVKGKGWGLFADQFIPSGQFVCEYTGELLTTKEARKRQDEYDRDSAAGLFSSALLVVREHLPSGKACFRINIDATRKGNIARFINHSCDGGNLSTVIVRNSGALIPRVCFFTSRDIDKDEELSFSYGDTRQRPEGLKCLCGSSNCFGVLPSENT